jgi:glycosyltransferase involved in cell wall biosynthesis
MTILRRLLDRLYALATAPWRWWPIDPPLPRRRPRPSAVGDAPPPAMTGAPRIAYCVWHFPVLSQTFVRREVQALRKSGVPLTVLADDVEDVQLLGEEERALIGSTRYLRPIKRRLLARYRRRFRRRRPLTYLNLFLYILSRRYGLTKTWAGDRRLFRNVLYLAGHIDDAGADRVHAAWGDRSGFTAMMAARLLDLPFSVQVRAHDLHDPTYRDALRETVRHADFVITNTLYNRPFIEALGRNGGPRVHTIYNGVELARFDPPPRPREEGRPLAVLCVARLVEAKGLVHLLDACALLRDRGLAFRCDVIGGPEHDLYGDYRERLMARHRELGLQEHVRFLGARPFAAVMDAYARADVFVLPCVVDHYGRRDITPNALIEAMAMKLPVVSTAMTGILEIVESGESGLLVPPGDPRTLADAVERIARDESLARALGEHARARVESRFDIDRNVHERVRVFASHGPGNGVVPEA